MGYEVSKKWSSFNYLGVLIQKVKKKVYDWRCLIEKTKQRIQSLGANWLNPASKLVLINIVLESFLIYICSLELAPKSIIHDIDKEIKRFL